MSRDSETTSCPAVSVSSQCSIRVQKSIVACGAEVQGCSWAIFCGRKSEIGKSTIPATGYTWHETADGVGQHQRYQQSPAASKPMHLKYCTQGSEFPGFHLFQRGAECLIITSDSWEKGEEEATWTHIYNWKASIGAPSKWICQCPEAPCLDDSHH